MEDAPEVEKQPEDKLILSIYLTKDGRVQVKGLIHDKILSYGILEAAKEAISQHHTQSNIQVVKRNGILDFVRNR